MWRTWLQRKRITSKNTHNTHSCTEEQHLPWDGRWYNLSDPDMTTAKYKINTESFVLCASIKPNKIHHKSLNKCTSWRQKWYQVWKKIRHKEGKKRVLKSYHFWVVTPHSVTILFYGTTDESKSFFSFKTSPQTMFK